MYVPLHGHSTFSFLEALGQPKDIVKQVKSLGMDAVAITDFNGMFAIPGLFLACEDSKDKDNPDDFAVKPIFGLEIGFVVDLNSSLVAKSVGNICILAETDEGYHNMMEMVAYANQDGLSNGTSKLDLKFLKEKSAGTIVFTGGELSWISKMQLSGESEEKIIEILEMIREIYGDRCYLEITAQDETSLPSVGKINKLIYSIAKKTGTKLIVNNDYHYVKESDIKALEVAMSIKDGTKMYDSNRRKPEGKYYIMEGEEIRKICINNGYPDSEIDEWIQNNGLIAESVNTSMLLHQKLFPKYETPENIKIFYDKYGESSIVYE